MEDVFVAELLELVVLELVVVGVVVVDVGVVVVDVGVVVVDDVDDELVLLLVLELEQAFWARFPTVTMP